MAQIALARPLRNALQAAVMRARDIAEAAAVEALAPYSVGDAKAPSYLDDAGRAFRNRLRAHARQLGDVKDDSRKQDTKRLTEEVAYEQWHRILFTRFLVENDLLIHPEFETPISLEYVEELAKEEGKDPWELAGEYASRMLPQIFRPDDPTQQLRLPKNRIQELERLVLGLDPATFKAGDALGWSYQFWQAKRKDEINASGTKIGAAELPAVTQLFTEDYMVEFLLHNSLGAWWVSNFPDKSLPVEMPYLRFVDVPVEGKEGETRREPAAGRFEGWPKSLKDFKVLDPCCGSGHFPVFLLHIIAPMRMALEGLSAAEAVDAVLRENIHALEIDPRCVEIAVFALALAAWTFPGAGGYRQLPRMNVACCGLPIAQKESEWLKLANGDERLREGMRALYAAFKDAPMLGSLIDPKAASGDLLGAGFDELAPMLEAALGKERIKSSDEATEAMLTANGLLQAARLLATEYALVVTNTPYLGRGNQADGLKRFCDTRYPHAKQDLANVMLERCLKLTRHGGVVQFVMPQNWLFLTSYRKQRDSLLRLVQWNLLARLGESAFESPQAAGAFVVLLTQTRAEPPDEFQLRGMDASAPRQAQEKAAVLRDGDVVTVNQAEQLRNPDAVVQLDVSVQGALLSQFAHGMQGVSSADYPRFAKTFWEVDDFRAWTYQQDAPDDSGAFSGRRYVLQLHDLLRQAKEVGAYVRGRPAWGQIGIAVAQMRSMTRTVYSGLPTTDTVAIVLPKQPEHLLPIAAFCFSQAYVDAVRALNQKVNLNSGYLTKVRFDLAHWQKVAAERYPHGLPKPYSDDPTQWIFHGHPCGSVVLDQTTKRSANGALRVDGTVLQIATARLLGYRWPAELDAEMELAEEQRAWVKRCETLSKFADVDGIVCIPAVKGERPAADRLLELLAAAYGDGWTSSLLDKLLADAGFADKTLEDWLRNGFFAQHCKLFHDRPFIWHIWDGERDGFSALVNYHTLDKKKLQTLAYTYVGGWIEEQKRQQAAGVDGAKELVHAAEALQSKLKKILEGERPCDIFVRWKALKDQPLGWDPDINDGVRVNIRPFMLAGDVGKKGAGILRDKPNIKWTKDRGTDPASAPWYELGPKYGEDKGARINEHHTTLDEKRKARGSKK
jgi:hypothetical protein